MPLFEERKVKIIVFSDLHGDACGARLAARISRTEHADKTVVCGDIFGGASYKEVAEALSEVSGVQYFLRGNNDYGCYDAFLSSPAEDYALMYHFGRTLFFTHGHRYNAFALPPFLKEGDAIVYGHTHVTRLTVQNGLFALNVGSICRPRDGVAAYMLLDEKGARAVDLQGRTISFLPWQN